MNSAKILQTLKSRGHKSTKIRQSLVEILLSESSPLSITDLLDKLSRINLNPNKTTVYREIEFLEKEGILQEVELGEGKKRYEISENHHHHIKCVNCGIIKDVHVEQENFKFQISNFKFFKKLGFKPIGHTLEFFGVCRNCQ